MAKTKKRTRRRKPLSNGGTVKRRKSRPRSKGGLSELFNPTVAANSFKSTLSSGIGGGGAILLNKMLPATSGKLMRIGIGFAISFVASSFGYHNVASGLNGGMVALSLQNGMLNDDDTSFANESVLSDQPLFLDEDGSPMVLEEGEDGSAGYRYLSDDEIQMLEKNGAFTNYQEVE